MLTEVINHYLQSAKTLDRLEDATAKNNASVTPVTPEKKTVLLLQPSSDLAVTPVIPVTPEKSAPQTKSKKSLSESDKTKLLSYLDAIGETNQAMIIEFLDECRRDTETLRYALQLAEDTLRVRHDETADFVRCSNCRHLLVGACSLFNWRIVVDKWRKCADFDQKGVVI